MAVLSAPSAPDTAAPRAVSGRHLLALDGLRALAVAGVLAYHLGLGWASGGYLGVDLFFVLSGFLITSLLLEEWVTTGAVRLLAFWTRRAKRLLPALFVLLVAIAIFVVLMGHFGPAGWVAGIDLPALRADAIATLLYVANWHAVFAHQSYFARFSAPSPLEHTWSLAIEEQFYLVWPPALVALLLACRRLGWSWRRSGVIVAVAGTAASAAWMAYLYGSGAGLTRVYFGTDTRMFDLLVGAGLAMLVAARPQPGRTARVVLHAAAPVAAAGLAWCWVTAGTAEGSPRSWMFDGGFLVCALLAGVVIADVRQLTPGPLGRVLSTGPLRWVGTISYGVYLWHWPIFVYMTTAVTGLQGSALDVARVGATLAAASASYYLVERPIRRHRFAGWRRTLTLGPLAVGATALAVVLATVPSLVVGASVPAAADEAAGAIATGGTAVPGAGGLGSEIPLDLPTFGRSDPLRVTVLGDSVAKAAEPAIAAALDATGEVRVTDATIDGFGLTTDPIWRRSLPEIVRSQRTQVVLATWSWDDECGPGAPTPLVRRYSDVCALERPRAYRAMLETAVRSMLAQGVSGVVFLQFPTTGPVADTTPSSHGATDALRAAGEAAWDRVARSVASALPGRVLYLPVAGSVLLDGRFSAWLPPADAPHAPKAQWLRVRTVDNVHLCPAGAARYADAVLADLGTMFGLPSPTPSWASGSWTRDSSYDTPPGSCPANHPPA